MRYRKLDANDDYTFGHGQADFYHDVPEAVGQAVKTRMWLFFSEWFLDTLEGTRWGGFPISDEHVLGGRILAESNEAERNLEVQQRILNTQGMSRIDEYYSGFDPNSRHFRVGALITTIYGVTSVFIEGIPERPPIPPVVPPVEPPEEPPEGPEMLPGIKVTTSTILPAGFSGYVDVEASSAIIIGLPPGPWTTGQYICIKDNLGNATALNITINGNGKMIENVSNLVLRSNWAWVTLRYSGVQWVQI